MIPFILSALSDEFEQIISQNNREAHIQLNLWDSKITTVLEGLATIQSCWQQTCYDFRVLPIWSIWNVDLAIECEDKPVHEGEGIDSVLKFSSLI